MNTGVYETFQIMVFSRYMPRIGISESYGSSILHFIRNLHTSLQSGYTNLHFHQQCREVPFSPHPLLKIGFVSVLCLDLAANLKPLKRKIPYCRASNFIYIFHMRKQICHHRPKETRDKGTRPIEDPDNGVN